MFTQDPLFLSPTFSDWLQSSMGLRLLEKESEISSLWLRRVFGYHALLLGDKAWERGLRENPINHRIWQDPCAQVFGDLSPLIAENQSMPLATDSIDLVVLPHVLEQSSSPHEILREAHRVLIPQGYLLISAFNPWSLFGLSKLIWRWRRSHFWGTRWISGHRLRDWLSLLGFTVLDTKTLYFEMTSGPVQRVLQRLLPQFGSTLLILAQKSVAPLTPIRPAWQTLAKKVPIAETLEPTANKIHSQD